jgi:hypothetical protein
MCKARKGVKIYRFWLKVYLPSLWRGVLGKSGCCEEECKPIIKRDVGGAPRVSPWLSAGGVTPFI